MTSPRPQSDKSAAPRKGKLRGRIAIVAVILIAVVGVMWFVPVLSVRDVQAEPSPHVTSDEQIAASGIALGDNMLRIDYQQASVNIARLPWIRSVKVTPKGPSTVEITVEERQSFLHSMHADGAHLVDQDGITFLIADPEPGSLEVIGVADEDQATLKSLTTLVASIPEPLRGAMKSIDAHNPEQIEIDTHEGRRIIWGSVDRSEEKARVLPTAWQLPGQTINLSNPEQISMIP